MNKYIEIDADLLKDLEDSEEEKADNNEEKDQLIKNTDYTEVYDEFSQIYGKNKRDYVDKEVITFLYIKTSQDDH
jgi:hypothetical protein